MLVPQCLIARRYWWPGLSSQILKYVQSCTKCLSRNIPPHLKLRPLIIPDEIPKLFERIAVDVQGPFRTSTKGNKYLITFFIVHSRWIEAFLVKETTAETAADLLIREIILRYGTIRSFLSDRGSNFLSQIINETCKKFQITKVDIAAYLPQSNAKLERIHRTYSDAISKFVDISQVDWDEYFPYI